MLLGAFQGPSGKAHVLSFQQATLFGDPVPGPPGHTRVTGGATWGCR